MGINKKKVVFITDKVYPHFIGGQEKRVYEYSRILKDAGCDVSIVSMKWWEGAKITEKEGIKYVSVCPKLELYKKNGKRHIWNNFRFGISFFLYANKTRADVMDIINFPYFPAIFVWLARIFGRKKFNIFICWLEYCGKDYWKKYLGWQWMAGYFLEKICFKIADKNIAISDFTKKRILKENKPVNSILVVPPFAVDIEKINSIKVDVKSYDIIYFGRLIYHKHVERMIELTERLKNDFPQIKSLIIGNGPDEKKLKELAEKKGLLGKSVIFKDFFEDYDDLIRHIKSSKIMAFPSEREGFGISVLEANTCGLPVLMLDYPENAARELICNGENGFVCKDDDGMLSKVSFLLSSEGLKNGKNELRRMSERSIQMTEKYSKSFVRKEIMKAYFEQM